MIDRTNFRGKCNTMMIACVSPSSEHLDETMLTLNYSRKAMNIRNEPSIYAEAGKEALPEESNKFRWSFFLQTKL